MIVVASASGLGDLRRRGHPADAGSNGMSELVLGLVLLGLVVVPLAGVLLGLALGGRRRETGRHR